MKVYILEWDAYGVDVPGGVYLNKELAYKDLDNFKRYRKEHAEIREYEVTTKEIFNICAANQ